jgi:hypothetical protein
MASRECSRCYYGGGQRVWPLRRLSCDNEKLASLHLIAPVIKQERHCRRLCVRGVARVPSRSDRCPVGCVGATPCLPRQLVDAAAAFNQEPSPRGVTGASGIALDDFGLRMSWSACHPHAISEGQSRYRADNHGHRRRPLSWPRHAPPARTHPANMPDKTAMAGGRHEG